MANKVWSVPASSGGAYSVLWNDDDHISCNCVSWTTGWKKRGSRLCKHTDRVVAEQGLRIRQAGDYWYITEAPRVDKRGPVKTAEVLEYNEMVPVAAKARSLDRKAKVAQQVEAASQPTIRRAQIERVRRNNVPLDESSGVEVEDMTFIPPMLASKMPDGRTADSYNPIDWVMEEKFDGHRIVLRVRDCDKTHTGMHDRRCGNFKAWSRGAKMRTLPDHIADAAANLVRGVYDGEIVVPAGKSYAVTDGANKGTESLVLFDIIEALGVRLNASQRQRRTMLETAWDAIPFALTVSPRGGRRPIYLTQQFAPSLAQVKEIWSFGGEGAIIKRLDAQYKPDTRSPDWIKVKKEESAVITIVGFENGKSGPFSVVVGEDKNGVPIKVKTLNEDELANFKRKAYAATTVKGETKIGTHEDFGRRLVVTMQERTLDGKARHAMWERWAGEQET